MIGGGVANYGEAVTDLKNRVHEKQVKRARFADFWKDVKSSLHEEVRVANETLRNSELSGVIDLIDNPGLNIRFLDVDCKITVEEDKGIIDAVYIGENGDNISKVEVHFEGNSVGSVVDTGSFRGQSNAQGVAVSIVTGLIESAG